MGQEQTRLADDARRWANDRFATARKVPTTEDYLRFPEEAPANWHVNVSLKLPNAARAQLYAMGQEIARRSGVEGMVAVPQSSIHVSLLWGRHLSPTPRAGEPVAKPGNWTRRDAREIAQKMETVFADSKPLTLTYDDVIALPKQVFAIPNGKDWPAVFDLANKIRGGVDELRGAGYEPSKSPLEGGPIVQSSLLLFPKGLDLALITDAVTDFRHGEIDAPKIEVEVSEVELSIHEHRRLDFPDSTSFERVGIRQTGKAIGTYQLGGGAQIEGPGR